MPHPILIGISNEAGCTDEWPHSHSSAVVYGSFLLSSSPWRWTSQKSLFFFCKFAHTVWKTATKFCKAIKLDVREKFYGTNRECWCTICLHRTLFGLKLYFSTSVFFSSTTILSLNKTPLSGNCIFADINISWRSVATQSDLNQPITSLTAWNMFSLKKNYSTNFHKIWWKGGMLDTEETTGFWW